MRSATFDVNGKSAVVSFEARQSLADLLREDLSLTATHIGCEQGVCGACTVMVDDRPVRSCITLAAACEGAKIRTLEGLHDDPLMNRLREAFSKNHALQCGFCTPGMLITSRDIISRLNEVDEKRIRTELAGNLCRCTGYVGIVAAIKEVMKDGLTEPALAPTSYRLGPPGAPKAIETSSAPVDESKPVSNAKMDAETTTAEQWQDVEANGVAINQSFVVDDSPDSVWLTLADFEKVAACVPGARLTSILGPAEAIGEVRIKLGPIAAAFSGHVLQERVDTTRSGLIKAAGSDRLSGTRARAIASYKLTPADTANSTRLDVEARFLLVGPLAQFGRSGLIRDVAGHMTKLFAGNLETLLTKGEVDSAQTPLKITMLASLFLKSLVHRLLGRE
jgi:carbon-monoxide dehydrogenase small subunit